MAKSNGMQGFAGSLSLTLIVANPLSAQDNVVINSPIDGYVVSIVQEGARLSGGSSIGAWLTLNFNQNNRAKVGGDASPCKEGPLKLDFLDAQYAPLASFSNGEIAKKDSLAAHVFSPLLERELKAAEALAGIAKERFDDAVIEIKEATALRDIERNHIALRHVVEKTYTDQQLEIAKRTPDQQDEMSAQTAATLQAEQDLLRARERAIFDERQDTYIGHDLPLLRDSAETDWMVAKCDVEILEATKKLGDVHCPQACKVLEVHALAGQWVTKGDPLVTVDASE